MDSLNNRRPRVAIVGAGMGGLASAIRLAASGAAVTVFERAEGPGGKARAARLSVGRQPGGVTVSESGVSIDTGPTVLTLPDVFESLFEASGARLSDHVTLHRADVLARHLWPDGTRLDLFSDTIRTRAAIEDVFGDREAAGFDRFAAHAARVLSIVDAPFMRGQRPTVLGTVRDMGLRALPDLMRIDGLRSLYAALGDFFQTPHLRQLFGRYATYVGSSPLRAPATLAVIAGVELAGVYHVEGGIGRLVDALFDRAVALGVEFRFDTPVAGIVAEGKRVTGLRLAHGAVHTADAVVVNADAGAVADGLFGPEAARAVDVNGERSLSAVTFTGLVAQTRPDALPLSHHTVIFAPDAVREHTAIFGRAGTPADATLYLCAQDRPATAHASPARTPERLLALVNAAALSDDADPADAPPETPWTRNTALQAFTDRLSALGYAPTGQSPGIIRTPEDWAALAPGSAGALYGRASHGWRQAFLRPSARTRLAGLYLAGGTVHPGAGLPMAALSGCRAAEALWADLPSISRSSPADTHGGTSTWSRTTVSTS